MYPGPHPHSIVSIASQPFIEELNGSFASLVKLFTCVKTLTALVDGVVCQVHIMFMLHMKLNIKRVKGSQII